MSMLRVVVLRQRGAALLAAPRRAASTSAPSTVTDHHDDHHHNEDTTVYPPETFANKSWRNIVLVTLGVLAFYKFAPSPQEETWLGNVLSHYKESVEAWNKLNIQHMLQSADIQAGNLLLTDAKLPPVHRYRFPQAFDQHSPFAQAVGVKADLNNLHVKTEKQ